MLQDLGGAFLVESPKLHPRPGRWREIAGVVQEVEAVEGTGVHTEENAQARPGPLGHREEQRGQLVERGTVGAWAAFGQNGLQVVEDEQDPGV